MKRRKTRPARAGRDAQSNQRCQSSAAGAPHGDVVGSIAAVRSEDEVLTKGQVAEWLKVNPRQLDRMGVPCLDLGHKTKRYLKQDVWAWLEAQRRGIKRAA